MYSTNKKLESKNIPFRLISDIKNPELKKPDWIKVKLPLNYYRVNEIKATLRAANLHTVCEEASCPNLIECFSKGTATFLIMGNTCTRKCTFCDVAYGRPNNLDPNEPKHLAETIANMKLQYVVITSVNRDDLHDGGANHFVECINKIREYSPNIKIEILTPDFRNCVDNALKLFSNSAPDIFNHNIETVERLYPYLRIGADYHASLDFLKEISMQIPNIPTKSGIMLGLGEEEHEIIRVMEDLRLHNVKMLTLGQYLQPTIKHYPVQRYYTVDEFAKYREIALQLGFEHVASNPLVRSSYHAEDSFSEKLNKHIDKNE